MERFEIDHKIDQGFISTGYTDEMCPQCQRELFNIPVNEVTPCPYCGKQVFPCSCCDEKCDYREINQACHRFKEVTPCPA